MREGGANPHAVICDTGSDDEEDGANGQFGEKDVNGKRKSVSTPGRNRRAQVVESDQGTHVSAPGFKLKLDRGQPNLTMKLNRHPHNQTGLDLISYSHTTLERRQQWWQGQQPCQHQCSYW